MERQPAETYRGPEGANCSICLEPLVPGTEVVVCPASLRHRDEMRRRPRKKMKVFVENSWGSFDSLEEEEERPPSPATHVFHLDCFRDYCKSRTHGTRAVPCPECRQLRQRRTALSRFRQRISYLNSMRRRRER